MSDAEEKTCDICHEAFESDAPFDVATCGNNHSIHMSCYERLSPSNNGCVLRCMTPYRVSSVKEAVMEKLIAVCGEVPNLFLLNNKEWVLNMKEEVVARLIQQHRCASARLFTDVLVKKMFVAAQQILDNGLDLRHPPFNVTYYINKLINNHIDVAMDVVRFLFEHGVAIYVPDVYGDITLNDEHEHYAKQREVFVAVLDYCRRTNQPHRIIDENHILHYAIENVLPKLFAEHVAKYSTEAERESNKNRIYEVAAVEECVPFYEALFSHFQYTEAELALAFNAALELFNDAAVEYMWQHRRRIGLNLSSCHHVLLYLVQAKRYTTALQMLDSGELDMNHENLHDLFHKIICDINSKKSDDNGDSDVENGAIARFFQLVRPRQVEEL